MHSWRRRRSPLGGRLYIERSDIAAYLDRWTNIEDPDDFHGLVVVRRGCSVREDAIEMIDREGSSSVGGKASMGAQMPRELAAELLRVADELDPA